jgi:tyrosine-protein kinase Etk/Wzc
MIRRDTTHRTLAQEDGPRLRDYINVIIRQRWLILLIFVTITIAALCIFFLLTPLYEATATLRIRSEGKGMMDLLGGTAGGGLFIDTLGMGKTREFDTEIELLKSRILAEEVVRRLGYQLQYSPPHDGLAVLFRRLKALLPWSSAETFFPPRQPAFTLRDIEVGEVDVQQSYMLTLLPGNTFVVQTAQHKHELGRGTVGHLFRTPEVAFIFENHRLKVGEKFTFTLLPFWQATEQFQKSITVAAVRSTEIVKLTAKATVPTLTSDMVATLAQEYIAFSLRQKTQEASQVLGFIAQQLAAMREQLQMSEGTLSRFKEKQGFITLSSETQSTLEKLTKTELALRQSQSDLAEAESLRQRLQAGKTPVDSRSIYALGTGQGSEILVQLATRLFELQVTLSAIKSQYTPRYPKVIETEQQIQGAKEKIGAELSTLIANLRSRVGSLQNIKREYEARLETLPQAELELANLTRQTRFNEEVYALFLKKQEEARLQEASTLSNALVIDPPLVPIFPISPKKTIGVAIAALLGLMLGSFVAFCVEYANDSIRMVEEAEQWIGLPLLGTIPIVATHGGKRRGREVPLVVSRQERGGIVTESFRSLRTNLQFLELEGQRRKTLAITSPQLGDGKSTVAANLALCLDAIGKKTLLVDADLRRPCLFQAFGLAKKPGLAEVLGEELPWTQAIHPVGATLHLLTCGEPSLSPAGVLASGRLPGLIKEWEAAYDYVLFDVPPVIPIADPVIVAALCQGILLVVRANVTSTTVVKRVQALLEPARVPVVGMVLNGLKSTWGYGYSTYHAAAAVNYSLNGNTQSEKSRTHL